MKPGEEIPWPSGLNKAVKRTQKIESYLREIAILPIPETINGVEVEQFKLKHWILLRAIESPFLIGGRCDGIDIGRFMWVVSGAYNPKGEGRDAYINGIVNLPNGTRFFRAIRRYIDRAMFDRPPQMVGSSKVVTTSIGIALIHKIAFAYGWTPETILDLRVAAIFQMLKWIRVEQDPKYPQFNPLTDRVMQTAMARMNAKGATNGG